MMTMIAMVVLATMVAIVMLVTMLWLCMELMTCVQVKQRTVASMAGLHSLTLHGNPWTCDCSLRPLIDWLVTANLPMADTPRCHAPNRLGGKRFADIPLADFACTPELLPAPRYVEANIGKQRQASLEQSAEFSRFKFP